MYKRTKRRNWYLWFLVAAGVAGLVALWLMMGRRSEERRVGKECRSGC